LYDQVAQNKRRSALLIACFVALVALVAAVLSMLFRAGPIGLVVAVLVAGGTAFFSYWKSDAIALRLSRARPAPQDEYPRLHNLVEGLCIAAGLPKPQVYVIDDEAPNAFATGRNPKHAAIAVTTGLLDMMNRMELEGVLAHELSHIKNYDILVSTLAVTMVGVLALVSDIFIRMLWWNGGRSGRNDGEHSSPLGFLAPLGFAILLLSPLLGRLLQYAVGRRRELLADVSGVEMTRYPPGLISALEKLKGDTTVVHGSSRATAHLWIEAPTAQNESEGRLSKWNRLFDTHPPIDERIATLREL
jgi:heat shock protein HtpX